MVLEAGIAYLCLKRNLNATFTICSFRNSRRQMNVLIYQIWTCLENRTYYISRHHPSSFSCNLFNIPMGVFFLKYCSGQYSSISIIIFLFVFRFFKLVSLSDSYFMLISVTYFSVLWNNIQFYASNHRWLRIAVAKCERWYKIFCLLNTYLKP